MNATLDQRVLQAVPPGEERTISEVFRLLLAEDDPQSRGAVSRAVWRLVEREQMFLTRSLKFTKTTPK